MYRTHGNGSLIKCIQYCHAAPPSLTEVQIGYAHSLDWSRYVEVGTRYENLHDPLAPEPPQKQNVTYIAQESAHARQNHAECYPQVLLHHPRW